ncbi:hypothetical protein MNBD_GAMMA09-2696 [hydrothermal vent metagenome]|uniref:Uncharacterized protein n=1 Tax=hydrothermal vent metagenome TaxID=652676 RepID=A0A3B0XFE1_9ZZZZ
MLKTILLFLLFFFQSYSISADEATKIVLHLNDMFKLSHLNNSVRNIRSELGENVKIKIVVNGKAVQLMLADNKASTEIINNILQYNVDVGLCHNAIRNNNINEKQIIKGLDVLPKDGNVTIINLQKKGYIYIKI